MKHSNKKSHRAFQSGVSSNKGSGDIIVKRMTIPLTISSTAGGVIAITSWSSTAVQTFAATEWSSFAARYQQYRVRKIHLVVEPCRPVQDTTGSCSELLCADFIGTSTPSSAAQVVSDERVRSNSTARPVRHVVTWGRNPNAKLWNPTSAAIPAANTFSLVFCSPTSPSLGVSLTIMTGYLEFEVELRGSQ